MSNPEGDNPVAPQPEDRAALGYPATEVITLDGRFVYPPCSEDLQDMRSRMAEEYGNRIVVLIPMAEKDPKAGEVIWGMVRHLLDQGIKTERMIMTTAGASDTNITTARKAGATVIDPDLLFDAINWSKLLPILNQNRRPSGRAGKGFNVFGGYLALRAMGLPDDVIHIQSDSEIKDYSTYDPVSHLVRALEVFPNAVHAKMAKTGRNNSTTMAARNMLRLLYHLPEWKALLPKAIQEFATEVYRTLREDPWMLTGEWLWKGNGFLNRPFATGYMEETLQALWSMHAPEYCSWQNVVYVGNKHDRQDGANGDNEGEKETAMMSTLSQFLWAVVGKGKHFSNWTLDEYAEFNRGSMSELTTVLHIGVKGEDCPVRHRRVAQESLIPPIPMLIEAGILDEAKLRDLVQKQFKGQNVK